MKLKQKDIYLFFSNDDTNYFYVDVDKQVLINDNDLEKLMKKEFFIKPLN